MAFPLLVLLQRNGVKLLGFEPRQTESKSVVLPLHHNLILVAKIGYILPHFAILNKNKINIWNYKINLLIFAHDYEKHSKRY